MKSINGLYEAHVRIRGRTDATEVVHRSKTYIEGRRGTEYVLMFHNRSSKRVLVLPSVDGLSVLDGKAAGLNSQGYVVGPYQQIEIPGWKVDAKTAAKFVFAEKGSRSNNPAKKTYAEQQGADPANIGVIGFAVFTEKERPAPPPPPPVFVPYPVPMPMPMPSPPVYPPYSPWVWPKPYDPYRLRYGTDTGVCNTVAGGLGSSIGSSGTVNANISQMGHSTLTASGSLKNSDTAKMMARSLSAPTPESAYDSAPVDPGLGTAFGQATEFNTISTEFERAHPNHPDAVLELIYDSLLNLEAMGVPVASFRPSRPTSARNAFPASPELSNQGCPPPKGWSKKKRR